jgi:hypothetical protein
MEKRVSRWLEKEVSSLIDRICVALMLISCRQTHWTTPGE